jgi:TRAP transporter TAXI family solute receptor
MKTFSKGMLLLVSLVLAASGIAGASAQEARNLSIATGGTGGVYYPLGGGLAKILSEKVPGWQATAEVTGGSVDNLKLVGAGRADLAFVMADAARDALKGEDKFEGSPTDVRALGVLYPNRMHVVTVEDTGIKSMADLKGKRVSTGSPGSATEVMAFRLLEAAGLDPENDIQRERLGAAESTNALKDRKIDAYFWVGGVPTAAVTDLAASPGNDVRLIDHAEYVDAMNEKYGNLYVKSTIPQTAYPGMDSPNQNASVWNLLVADQKMPEDVAYTVVKTLFESKPEMVAVHKDAESFDLANQAPENTPIPYHPGAKKYFAEKGITID